MIDAQSLRQMDDLVDLRNAHYQTLNDLHQEHIKTCAPILKLINELDLTIGTMQTEWLHSGHSDFSGITLDEVNVNELPNMEQRRPNPLFKSIDKRSKDD